MPEGPSILILKEKVLHFKGKKVLSAETDGRIDFDIDRLFGQKIVALKTWGKHFLIVFDDFTIRIHLLMFGDYYIDSRKEAKPRLGLRFNTGELNFYTCSAKLLEGKIDEHYDWTADIMNKSWDSRAAKKKVKAKPEAMICDILLDQDIFSGVGNIIKNEALYRVHVHPESVVSEIPDAKMRDLIAAARDYSFDFLDQKKRNELSKNWQAYAKKKCKRCDLPIHKGYVGKLKRRSFFCDNCQKKYS